jgi:hypothetical protein
MFFSCCLVSHLCILNRIYLCLFPRPTVLIYIKVSALLKLYLVQRSVETTYYTVNGHCSCRPANIRLFRPGIFKLLKCTECFHY